MNLTLEIAILVGLVLLNGFFAMAELAVVSSRRIRLQQMAESGSTGAVRALSLLDNSGQFLSAVQVGITLIGILSGAFGGATIGPRLGEYLDGVPLIAPYGREIAVAIVVICITILSVIVGELVPKQVALAYPETIATRVARPLQWVSIGARPVVWFLERSSAGLLTLLRIPSKRAGVTEEEVRFAIAEGTEAGVFEQVEEEMIHGVLALADSSVPSIMTPRPDVYWIDLDDEPEVIEKEIADCPYSHIVIARGGDLGRPLGVVQKKALVEDLIAGKGLLIEKQIRQPIYVPEGVKVLHLLEKFRRTPIHIAFVVDEYGDFLGVATLTDILEAVAGELREEHQTHEEEIKLRADGSWLVDGRVSIDDLSEKLGLKPIDGEYHTVAGLALEQLARIPVEGDVFDLDQWRVEVIDMDGKRIDKMLFVPRPPPSVDVL